MRAKIPSNAIAASEKDAPFSSEILIFSLIQIHLSFLDKQQIYYEQNSFMTAEYYVRIDGTFPEEELEEIQQNFYLHPAVLFNKKWTADNIFVAYPKT